MEVVKLEGIVEKGEGEVKILREDLKKSMKSLTQTQDENQDLKKELKKEIEASLKKEVNIAAEIEENNNMIE